MRIAAHISASEWGGAERRSLALLAGLATSGHEVVVYCNTARIAEKTRDAGLRAVISPLSGDIMVHHAARFAAHLRAQKPDVLLLITFRRLWLGALAGRLAGVPRIMARVGLASDVARSAKYRFVLKHWVSDVVVNAHSLRAPFIASLPADADVDVTVIPNGVRIPERLATGDESRRNARAALGIPQDAFVVGTVARVVKQKRIDRLLRAVAAVADVHVVIAGDGALHHPMTELARDLRIADRTHFTGHEEDVGRIHAALDAYIVASDQEGMSSGMLEALASGVPVISTRVSGAEEALLAEPACGLVVDFGSDDIAAAIAALRTDPVRLRALADHAAAVARERYSLDAMAAAWERLLTAGGAS